LNYAARNDNQENPGGLAQMTTFLVMLGIAAAIFMYGVALYNNLVN
jgi:hypothetical protein